MDRHTIERLGVAYPESQVPSALPDDYSRREFMRFFFAFGLYITWAGGMPKVIEAFNANNKFQQELAKTQITPTELIKSGKNGILDIYRQGETKEFDNIINNLVVVISGFRRVTIDGQEKLVWMDYNSEIQKNEIRAEVVNRNTTIYHYTFNGNETDLHSNRDDSLPEPKLQVALTAITQPNGSIKLTMDIDPEGKSDFALMLAGITFSVGLRQKVNKILTPHKIITPEDLKEPEIYQEKQLGVFKKEPFINHFIATSAEDTMPSLELKSEHWLTIFNYESRAMTWLLRQLDLHEAYEKLAGKPSWIEMGMFLQPVFTLNENPKFILALRE